MASDRHAFVDQYCAMDTARQARFLAKLAMEFNLFGRGTYEPGTEAVENAPLLRKVNEAQHRVIDQLVHLLEHHDKRYPDDVFAGIILENCRELRVEPQWFIDRVESYLNR